MSFFQHCSCTKARVSDSPSSPPFDPTASANDSYEPVTKEPSPSASASACLLVQDDPESDITMTTVATPLASDFQPDPSHYELRTIIGKGCNESVFVSLAKHRPTNTYVAIKRTNLERCDLEFNIIHHEISLSRQMMHSNICPIYCSFVHNNEIWAVMPIMAYGSCKDLIHAHFTEGISELAIAHILYALLQGLDYLHQKGVIHRGVRASHLLISADGLVTLSGLRSSYSMVNDCRQYSTVHDFPAHLVTQLYWLSPEVLEQNIAGYDTKSDIYSVGITACELASGYVPYADMPPSQMLYEKLNGSVPRLLDSTTLGDSLDEGVGDSGVGSSIAGTSVNRNVSTPYHQRTYSSHFHQFVEQCVQSDYHNRPTAAALLAHPFFRQIKRRTSEALPELLRPLKPITDIANLQKDHSQEDSLADNLQSVNLNDAWIF